MKGEEQKKGEMCFSLPSEYASPLVIGPSVCFARYKSKVFHKLVFGGYPVGVPQRGLWQAQSQFLNEGDSALA